MPAAPDSTASGDPDLYAALGVSSVASSTEIRRAYRTLITKVRGTSLVSPERRDPRRSDSKRSSSDAPQGRRTPRDFCEIETERVSAKKKKKKTLR
jgi:hypothetical protein